MDVPRAMIIAGALIAAAVLFVLRWEIVTAGSAAGPPVTYRLDRWTGDVTICHYPPGYDAAKPTYALDCAGR